MSDWAKRIEEMKRSADFYEYQKGYSDGFKEGYNKALEQYMEIIQKIKSPTVFVVKEDDLIKDIFK